MRLIDADRLKKLFINTCTGGGLLGKISNMIIEWACSFVDDMPTIDAEPVRQGEWLEPDRDGSYTYDKKAYAKCSVCGGVEFLGYSKKYCPNCGAKMDGERRTDETNCR